MHSLALPSGSLQIKMNPKGLLSMSELKSRSIEQRLKHLMTMDIWYETTRVR
jgi:hypothetical protein